LTNLLLFRIRKKTGAEDVEYTIDDKDFQKRYEGKLGKSGEFKNTTITPGAPAKKDEGGRKSGNATPAPAISTKVTGGGGFKTTAPTAAPENNAQKKVPQPIDKYEKDLNKSNINNLNKEEPNL
jgi:hypothetical protein